MDAYKANPLLVGEHGRQEDSFRTGGYAHRQVLELVQNAADALRRSDTRGRVELVLQGGSLYCANEGAPFTRNGLEAVCHAYLSDKRGDDMGRFGLGFKSVLGVTDAPLVLSRSISFSFDAEQSRRALTSVAPKTTKYPVLRLPILVDAPAVLEGDPVLEQLGRWAQTIVKLPLTRDIDRLAQDLTDFPHEFLLFAPFVNTLNINVEGVGEREFRCDSCGQNRYQLVGADGKSSDWMVWHQTHRPSDTALAEVSEAIRRPEVTVTYAAPQDETQKLGRFWAYFPLMDFTSARGIHNAPWHISDDRTNLLPGQFNDELLEVLAALVVSALPHLVTDEDPARHLDYMPARDKEADNFGDLKLIERVPALAVATACVPDANGILRQPTKLDYANTDLKIEVASFIQWHNAPARPVRSPHWTCYTTHTRRARLRRLVRGDLTRPSSAELSASEWLEELVPDGTDAQCDSALGVYFSVTDEYARNEMARAEVIPDVDGMLARLNQTSDLFLRGNPLSTAAGIRLVRPSFLARQDVEARLRSIGFADVDPANELRRLATTAANRWAPEQWEEFWQLVLEVSVNDAEQILLDHIKSSAVLKVRCQDGSWQHVGGVVVPGVVAPLASNLAVDDQYHELHLGLLAAIGVGSRPVITPAAMQDLTLLEYRRLIREAVLATLPRRGRPSPETLDFVENAGPAPLHVLRRFADTGDVRARTVWTRELLEIRAHPTWTLWTYASSRVDPTTVTAPHLWAAQHYGLIDTAWGPREPDQALHPDQTDLAPMLPVATWAVASKLDTIESSDDVPLDMWREFLSRMPTGGSPVQLGELIADAFVRLPSDETPQRLPAVEGSAFNSVPPTSLIIAHEDDEIRALTQEGLAFVAVKDADAAEALIEAWGCKRASETLRVEVVPDTPSEPVIVLDRFRRLRDYASGKLDGWDMVSCSALQLVVSQPTGTESRSYEFAAHAKTIYFENAMDNEDLLERISDEFALDLDLASIDRILKDAQSEQVQAAMAASRVQPDAPSRLLALLPAATLEAKLPIGLLEIVRSVSGDEGDRQIAELLLHVHGYNVLGELRHELKAAGYPVPDKWAGAGPAVAFVRALGFPAEYGGEGGQQLESDLTILGPPNLESLHPYQKELAAQIRELLRPTDSPGRALLFLPTGAGKTRVTVEAISRSFLDRELIGPVLWIAQTEELCEQAVQTWSTVWREFGDRPLNLSRLWSTNEVAASDTDAHVVVATDAKLDKVREKDDYEWLRNAAAVVIDEAHGATAVGITATLRWLGIDQRQTKRPLLGLTATPFKGSADESHRLATRFGSRLLNVLGDDPYGTLQQFGVLARVEHRVLRGSSYALNVAEREKFETFRDVPQSVLDRIGRDRDRTLTLLRDIAEQPDDWPILVFTSSVLAAQTLSALLRVRGIKSSSVSGSTPQRERRRTIDAFRSNEIRVLTNCNVLTQGFDAPAVRALYIARPTFSPNAYIQMVGRGLRGPLNGGKPDCQVVNMADTFEAFGEQLAYTQFDYIWERQGAGRS
ncbi:DEAD/DEAH box helicase [Mycobacterium sp. 1423905.2]|uniref:DEAD/DEAH box helicase n=1 Tax=Mycobacterium sp. 1423905.2 TaxID=1856859 RepID=UPI0007FD8965|nr:DEAD/DEAH box helicase [Mycobacterium sp. 1423905.2]OBJ53411.1 hypothetical protein A9W95_18285 [Mycobacterium sp. 1423905.2]